MMETYYCGHQSVGLLIGYTMLRVDLLPTFKAGERCMVIFSLLPHHYIMQNIAVKRPLVQKILVRRQEMK